MSIKVGKKFFPKNLKGISAAKEYSRLTDQTIEQASKDLQGANKFLSNLSKLKGIKSQAHSNLKPFKSGYGKGVDERGGDTAKHSNTPRFKKDNIK